MQQDAQRRANPAGKISGKISGETSGETSATASSESAEQTPPTPDHRRLIAVYPGTFDPVHNGHIDIARRAAHLVDELIIAVYATPNKKLLFSTDERVDLWRATIAEQGLTNVRVERFEGLTVDVARRVGAKAIVRGLRAVTDFELEFQQALMNRNLAPEIETLMIVTALRHLFVSASLLKEVARLDGELDGIVTPTVARAIHEKLGQRHE
ncbi:MAG TPA: pantetheine-phosphate adenylyltransferase [Ktedonobacterales bacterium]|nr:pantetheine-phosphate adenylyltransferase [Ktedonobacterales bacterium]